MELRKLGSRKIFEAEARGRASSSTEPAPSTPAGPPPAAERPREPLSAAEGIDLEDTSVLFGPDPEDAADHVDQGLVDETIEFLHELDAQDAEAVSHIL